MDNQRLLIWAFFGLMAWITYQTWVQQYGPQPVQPAVTAEVAAEPGATLPDIEEGSLPTIDDTALDAPAPEATRAQSSSEDTATAASVIEVTTDVLELQISTQGGTIQAARLLQYPVAKDQPDVLVELLSTDAANYGLVQSGIRTANLATGASEPTHQALFTAASLSYDLGSADELVVPLRWTGADGITVEKRYLFRRGSYAIDIEQELTNNSADEWRGAEYAQIRRYSR